jgi:hypothetical protein
MIVVNDELQSRANMDPDLVEEYADAMRRGADLPPVRVVGDEDKGEFFLFGGFHRIAALDRIKGDDPDYRLPVELVSSGGEKDAIWLSAAENQSHGLRRSNADKRRAAELAVKCSPSISDRALADHIGVSQPFVSKIRKELEGGGDLPEQPERQGKDGKVRKQPDKPEPQPLPSDAGEVAEFVDSLHDRLKAIRDEIEVELDSNHPAFREVNGEMFKHIFDELQNVLKKQCRPFKPCPRCGGDGCSSCKDRGFVSKDAWDILNAG